jgi:glycosyltransferase involved in cell wall biosynthesis
MQSLPLISVILPVYNGERYLSQAINSLVAQTYKNIEIIIVDDGSIDNSLKIANDYSLADTRIQVVSNKINQTLPVCLNIGHNLAKGDFITWTSDDNYYQENAISHLYEILIKKDVDIVYSNYLIIDEKGEITGQSKLKPIEFLIFSGVIGACFLYKREVFKRNNGYKENLFLVEDFDFWLRSSKHSRFYKVENPGFYFYRYHSNSLTVKMKSNKELRERFIKNLRELYRDFFENIKLDDPVALISFIINRFTEGTERNIQVFESKTLLKDLSAVADALPDISSKDLRKYVLEDAIDATLKNREFQKFSILYKMHKQAGKDLFKFPTNKYLALWKKCLI